MQGKTIQLPASPGSLPLVLVRSVYPPMLLPFLAIPGKKWKFRSSGLKVEGPKSIPAISAPASYKGRACATVIKLFPAICNAGSHSHLSKKVWPKAIKRNIHFLPMVMPALWYRFLSLFLCLGEHFGIRASVGSGDRGEEGLDLFFGS